MTGGQTDKMTAFGGKERLRNLRCCVVMPTYNNAGTLRDVISEVLEYCSEVIVVNDGSTDATAQIISTFGERIRSLSQERNQGKGVARLCRNQNTARRVRSNRGQKESRRSPREISDPQHKETGGRLPASVP